MSEDHLQVHEQKGQPHEAFVDLMVRAFLQAMSVVAMFCYDCDTKFTQDELKTVNIEKIIVVPDEPSDDLTNYEDQPHNAETVNRSELPTQMNSISGLDLAKLAFAFGQYLNGLRGDQAYASEACKVVYQKGPDAQDLLKRCGKLKGLVPKFSFLIYKTMGGGANGGTYLMKLDKGLFAALVYRTEIGCSEGVDS